MADAKWDQTLTGETNWDVDANGDAQTDWDYDGNVSETNWDSTETATTWTKVS